MQKKILWMKGISTEEITDMLRSRGLQAAATYRRILAYTIDVALYIIAMYPLKNSNFLQYLVPWTPKSDTQIVLFYFWMFMAFYYVFCTLIFGETIGCLISKVNPISILGERITVFQALARGGIIGVTSTLLFPWFIIIHSFLVLIYWKRDSIKRTIWDVGSATIVVQQIQN